MKVDTVGMVAAAYLRSQGKDQNEIANRLQISQSQVSRYIGEAKKRHILELKFAGNRVSQEDLAQAMAKVQTEPLEKMLQASNPGFPIPALHVYPCRSHNTSDAAWKLRIEGFSSDCAEDLLTVLGSASVLGVAWGVMIASAVDAMRSSRRTNPRSKQTIIPLLGEPLGRPITQHSSSVLASNLAEILDSRHKKPLSLAPVPAFIPGNMTTAETKAIRRFIGMITAYRDIYGEDDEKVSAAKKPWIEQVDAILTSVSRQDRPLGDDDLIRAAGIERKRLNELMIGDLSGAVMPRPNLDRQSKAEIKRIMSQWTGVKLEQLERCAARAGDEGRGPGVIVLAIGANKAAVVHEALRRGLIQHLFMDEDLAEGLGRICAGTSA